MTATDQERSSARASRIANRVVTAILAAVWVLLLLRQSEPATRTVLGRYSPFYFALIIGWGSFLVLHFLATRYTRLGRRIFTVNLWLVVVSAVIALGAAELTARAVFPPRSNALLNYLWQDPELGVNRLRPDAPGHDENGFRNPAVPSTVDVLFIGDSQTYGNGVPRERTFASRFGQHSGSGTYNLALGGWGPVEYYWALREFGAELAPRVVIVFLYLGNDLYDILEMEGKLDLVRLPTMAPVGAAELRRHYSEYSEQLKRTTPPARKIESTLNRIRLWDVVSRTAGWTFESHDFYAEWGRRYAAEGRSDTARHWIFREPPFYSYDDGATRTVFTPTRRYFPVAPQLDPVVPVALTAVRGIRDLSDDIGAELVVAVVPTKEEVYAPYLATRNVAMPRGYRELLSRTRAVRAQLQRGLDAEGVRVLDLTPALQEAAGRGESLYPESQDGHPNAIGHEVIATMLLNRL